MTDRELQGRMAAQIRACRKESGLTISQLAELAGIDAGFLAYIETGKKAPSLSTAARLARSLDVPLHELFGGAPHARADRLRKGSKIRYRLHMRVRSLCHKRSEEEQTDILEVLRHMSPKRVKALLVLLGR